MSWQNHQKDPGAERNWIQPAGMGAKKLGGGVGSKKEGQTEDWGLVQKANDLCYSRG